MGLQIRDERQMKALTGLSQAQFDHLLSVFSDIYQATQQKTYEEAAILGEWLVILMNVSSPIAFRFRRYVWRQQQALSQRFSILRPPLFPRTYLLRAGCG